MHESGKSDGSITPGKPPNKDCGAPRSAEEKVGWVLDADIRGFFDAISREWPMKFVEHRIADQRVLATRAPHLSFLSGATLARLTRGRSPVR